MNDKKIIFKNEDVQELLDALKLTQDSARMATFAVDMRLQINPNRAVDYFNSYFPEIYRILEKIE